jgi:HSP20 family molecular chaperone IbpA
VEMDYGPFERRVRLMVDVDPDVTPATYEAGVREVRLILTERDAGARKIDIQTGRGDE